ncbi:unnamed protein product [Absidia cylindrospora]
MATKPQSLRLDFLLQASNKVISQCPTLSQFYMQHYQETLRHNDLRAPRTVDRLSCPRCGQIYLAGYNTSVELASHSSIRHDNDSTATTTKNKKKKNQKNILVYTCHACHHQRKFNGSFKRYIPTSSRAHTTNTTTLLAIATEKVDESHLSASSGGPSASTPSTSKSVSITNKNKEKKNTTQAVPSNKRPLASSPNQQQQPSKKKSKGSKKNQLQSLLASRKDQNSGGGSGAGGLGLGDFLSSL